MGHEARQPLRLLVLSHMYPSRVHESAGVFIHRHVQALQEAGVDLRVVSPLPWAPRILWYRPEWRQFGETPNKDVWEGVAVNRVRYLQLPTRAFQPWAGVSMSLTLAPFLRRLRRTFPFDLIHSHTVTPDGLAALHLGRMFAVPTVNSARGSDLNEYPHNHPGRMAATRRVLLETDRTLAVSAALASVASELTEGRAQSRVIYNGVDQRVFHPEADTNALRQVLGLPLDRLLLTYVGRCERDKGVEELLLAFTGLATRFPDWMLVCLGEGGYRSDLLNRVRLAGLEDRVHAPGRVDHSTVASVLRASNAFVLPSWSEGMPNGLLEAMACGLPCVATRVGGIPEVLEHGHNGLLTSARDADALESTLEQLLADPVRASGFGQQALQTIRSRFSWASNAQAHLALYHDLLETCGTGRRRT